MYVVLMDSVQATNNRTLINFHFIALEHLNLIVKHKRKLWENSGTKNWYKIVLINKKPTFLLLEL